MTVTHKIQAGRRMARATKAQSAARRSGGQPLAHQITLAVLGLGTAGLLVRLFRPAAEAPSAAVLADQDRRRFSKAIARMTGEARQRGLEHLDINAGVLHRRVGGYPGPQHHMALCCAAMREALGPDDFAIREPRGGSGPALTLRYHLD